MTTLQWLVQKYDLNLNQRSPIEIPNVNRFTLLEWLRELDFKVGVEVGVARADYSRSICEANPQMQLYGVDPWIVHKEYTDYTIQVVLDRNLEVAQSVADSLPNFTIIKKYSRDAVKDFDDNSIDFVYIDGDHSFNEAANDIVWWTEKVKPGGIISGHDYFKHRNTATKIHVYEMLHGYTAATRVHPWFILGQNAMLPGELRDKSRSFFWIK